MDDPPRIEKKKTLVYFIIEDDFIYWTMISSCFNHFSLIFFAILCIKHSHLMLGNILLTNDEYTYRL